MEDVRQYTFGSLPGTGKNAAPTGRREGGRECVHYGTAVVNPAEEQYSAVDDLITNMDLMAAGM